MKTQCQSTEWNLSEMENQIHILGFIKFGHYNFVLWFFKSIKKDLAYWNYKCLDEQMGLPW